MHCVDLGESFQTHIYLQNFVSIQPRTSPVKFAASCAGSELRARQLRTGWPSAASPSTGFRSRGWSPCQGRRAGAFFIFFILFHSFREAQYFFSCSPLSPLFRSLLPPLFSYYYVGAMISDIRTAQTFTCLHVLFFPEKRRNAV